MARLTAQAMSTMQLVTTTAYHKGSEQPCPACWNTRLQPGHRVWIARLGDGSERHVCSELCVKRLQRASSGRTFPW